AEAAAFQDSTICAQTPRRNALRRICGEADSSFAGQGEFRDHRRRTRTHGQIDREGKERREAQMIKASLLLVLAYCLSKLLRHRSAAERHILWVASIFAAALLPLMILVLPELRFQVSSQIAAVVLPDGVHDEQNNNSGKSTFIHAI